MSYVGAPFKHDVFISYARAEKDTGSDLLVKWSHHVASRIISFLNTRFNPGQPDEARIDVFIDEHGLQSGDKLPDALKVAVENSAFLLVLMSPSYIKSRWCKEELAYHFAESKKHGRIGHCVVVRAQHLADDSWPEPLRDDRGGPVLYRDLVDPETQLAIGLDDFETPALKAGTRQVFIELKQRIEDFRKFLEARKIYDAPVQAPPVRPVIYLHARPEAMTAWQNARQTLKTKAVVSPDSLPNSADDVYIPGRRKDQLMEYSRCHGLAVLRTSDSDVRLDVKTIYLDRQLLFQDYQKNIPWAIVDEVGDDFQVAADYGVPRVMTSEPDWPEKLLQKLSLG